MIILIILNLMYLINNKYITIRINKKIVTTIQVYNKFTHHISLLHTTFTYNLNTTLHFSIYILNI